MSIDVGIIGCGINGLACGIFLQEKLENFKIRATIHAERHTPNVMSDIAAGLVLADGFYENPEHLIKKWTLDTLDYLAELRNETPELQAHIFDLQCFSLQKNIKNQFSLAKIMPNFQYLDEKQMKSFPNFNSGECFTTRVSHTKYLLNYLMKRFEKNGGKFIEETIDNINEFQSKYSYQVVINCAGLGNMKLLNDSNISPIRGQIHLVYAPWIKSSYFSHDRHGYIIPQSDGHVVLGGISQINDFHSAIRESERQEILEKCCEIFPSLNNVKIVESRVGFRPGRNCVRRDGEIIKIQGRQKYLLLHNYGHCGAGWTLFGGCAKDVLFDVQNYLNSLEAKL